MSTTMWPPPTSSWQRENLGLRGMTLQEKQRLIGRGREGRSQLSTWISALEKVCLEQLLIPSCLRRSGESTSGSSPCSERNETPGSPASPTNSSPARWNLQISSLRFVKKDLYNQHFFCVCSNTIWKLRIFLSKVQVPPLFHIWEETCLSTSLSPAWSHCSHPQPNPWGKWGGRQQSRGGQSQARGGSGSWCSRWCCCLAKTWTAT